MKREFADSIRCPSCGNCQWSLEVREEDDREIRGGRLVCGRCGDSFEIRNGVVDMLRDAGTTIDSEVAGWHQLAGPLDESLASTMLQLPSYPHPPWTHVAPDFFQVFQEIDLAGARIVDVGAGRTWSSRHLKLVGQAAEVVAVDILTTRFLGLETADLFFAHDRIHFERLRADLHRIPLRDGWADVVFSAASVHHSSDLGLAFTEFARVLRPGGRLVFVSEPCKREAITATRPDNEETAHGINEHIYSYAEYSDALTAAGFRFRRMTPRSISQRTLARDPEFLEGLPKRMRSLVNTPTGRRLFLAAVRGRTAGRLLYRLASLPLSVVAWKS